MGKFSDVSSCLVFCFVQETFASAFLDTIHSLLRLIEFPYPSLCVAVVAIPQPSQHKRMHAYVSSVSWLLCQVIYLLSLMSVTRFLFSFFVALMIYFLLKHLASFKSSTSVRVLMEFFPLLRDNMNEAVLCVCVMME